MKLSEIIKKFSVIEKPNEDIEVSELAIDSKKVKQGSLFFCLKGNNSDGFDYIDQALKSGAVCVVCDRKPNVQCNYVLVECVRSALSVFSANFFNNPQEKLKIIGIVGTNGKTSTCHVIKSILSCADKKVAVIGTLGVISNEEKTETGLTTPDPIELFQILRDLVNKKVEYVAMEVSAHAIYLKKTQAIRFSAIAFTNCTQDHLDYFKTFAEYRAVKKSVLSSKHADLIVLNADDELGQEMSKRTRRNVVTYGIDNPCDVFAVNEYTGKNGIKYVANVFDSLYEIKSKLIGRFNIYNTLCAITVCYKLGIDITCIAKGIEKMDAVDGRMQKVTSFNQADIYVDYAHTPDGLEKSLLSLREITSNNLICLFGCGGNRDKTKRSIMGRIAGDIADFVVLTSDNPRFEDAHDIMRDIEFGLRESTLDYICIQNREKALDYAIRMLNRGDSLLIAGKGAETYQEIMGVKHEFSDKEIVLQLIENDR